MIPQHIAWFRWAVLHKLLQPIILMCPTSVVSEGAPSLTGLEGSAVGGQGSGITPFVPSRQMFSLTSTNLKVDISPFVNEALRGFGSAAGGGANAGTVPFVSGFFPPPMWRFMFQNSINSSTHTARCAHDAIQCWQY